MINQNDKLNLKAHIDFIRKDYEYKKETLALEESQQVEKLKVLKQEIEEQSCRLGPLGNDEKNLVSTLESLTLQLSELTSNSSLENFQRLSEEMQSCDTIIEKTKQQLTKLENENSTHQATLKHAEKVCHTHEKRVKKRLKEYNEIQAETEEMAQATVVLNARVTKTLATFRALLEELHQPTHGFVNGPLNTTSISEQISALDKLYSAGSSVPLYFTPTRVKSSHRPVASSAKKSLDLK